VESREKRTDRVKKIITTLNKHHPDAKLALDFSSPLELLIALILAAQARDDLVNSVTSTLFRTYRTAADWANAGPRGAAAGPGQDQLLSPQDGRHSAGLPGTGQPFRRRTA